MVKKVKLRTIKFFIFAILLVSSVATAWAKPLHITDYSPLVQSASQQLLVEKTRKALLASKLQILTKNKALSANIEVDPKLLQQASLAVVVAEADLDSINLTLLSAQQTVNLTQSNIDALQNQSPDNLLLWNSTDLQQGELQEQIKQQHSLLALQQERVKVLQDTQTVAQQVLAAAKDWNAQLQTKYQLQQQQSRQQQLDQFAVSLQQQQQSWLTRLATLNQQLQANGASSLITNPQYTQLEMEIFEAEEKSNLSQVELDLARLRDKFADLSLTPSGNLSLSNMTTIDHEVEILTGQLKQIDTMLHNKQQLLQERIKITKNAIDQGSMVSTDSQAYLAMLYGIQSSYTKQLTYADNLSKQVDAFHDQFSQLLSKQLASRQSLPGLDLQQWLLLGEKMQEIPALTWQVVQSMQKSLALAINGANPILWFIWVAAGVLWGLLIFPINRLLKRAIKYYERNKENFLATNAVIVCLKLLKEHLIDIMLILGIIGELMLMNIPLTTFSLLIELMLVYLGFGLLLGITRYSLLESTINKSGSDVRLYRRLKWVLRLGCLLTLLTVLVHQIPVAYDVQDLFARLFMLFLLVIALVLMRGWEEVPTLLEPYLEHQRPYIRQVVRWLSVLVPLTILSNSLLGLIGYVELAWSIAAYQGIFLIVFTGYLIVRGLLGELMKLIADQVIKQMRNGWLWTEAILKPIHQVFKLLLIIFAFYVLFVLYGWGKASLVVTSLNELLNFHLFTLAGSSVTPLGIIKLTIFIAVLIWATKWAREFAYRWLFSGTKDIGLRNSLSIFTQYAVVIIGILLALRIIGINPTALTVVASTFAFGVGLGLRDLANNFMCGILLLIERPVRVGDYVSLGDFEGDVVHIGMRSITITTDDHKELLVPNADAFSRSFVNWTHRDSIVRTQFKIRVSREDDPQRVRELIADTVKNAPGVVAKPPVEVYFKKMEDMLLEFNIDYFIDMKVTNSRSAVLSKVLFALWEKFKVEGIHPPEHHHEIMLLQR